MNKLTMSLRIHHGTEKKVFIIFYWFRCQPFHTSISFIEPVSVYFWGRCVDHLFCTLLIVFGSFKFFITLSFQISQILELLSCCLEDDIFRVACWWWFCCLLIFWIIASLNDDRVWPFLGEVTFSQWLAVWPTIMNINIAPNRLIVKLMHLCSRHYRLCWRIVDIYSEQQSGLPCYSVLSSYMCCCTTMDLIFCLTPTLELMAQMIEPNSLFLEHVAEYGFLLNVVNWPLEHKDETPV